MSFSVPLYVGKRLFARFNTACRFAGFEA
jgi:hypothetical protein